MRVLLLTTRRRLGASRLRSWTTTLGVKRGELTVVSMLAELPAKPLAAREVLVLPRSKRRGALPLSLPTKASKGPVLLGGSKLRRVVEWNLGRRIEPLLVRPAEKELPEELSERFAARCAASPRVQRLFAGADVVVALDNPSCWAAWQMAQDHEGPRVVSGITAGAKALAAARESAEAAQ